MTVQSLRNQFSKLPIHIVIIGICVIWLIPTLGLMVTSLRPVQDANETGWWTILSDRPGAAEYEQSCAECHGANGAALPDANLSNPDLVSNFSRSIQLVATFNKEFNDQIHLPEAARPDAESLANILDHMRRISGIDELPRAWTNNYEDALVGYRGTDTYESDCAAGTQSVDLTCDFAGDLGNPRGMAQAFLNTIYVAIPATLLPLIFAAVAGYAFAWLHFRGRIALFAVLIGLQIIPLQMTLIPISRLYAQIGLNGTFLGVWLFHTGFGLPYAIYLMRNFIGSLPREIFESAYLDGASHWTAFYRLALPLSVPALASLAIFQFLWVWNDLLVALVYLGGTRPVLTYQINGLVQSLGGGWQLLTAAAFISILLPLIVFFGLQRYFVRGLTAGSVKG